MRQSQNQVKIQNKKYLEKANDSAKVIDPKVDWERRVPSVGGGLKVLI